MLTVYADSMMIATMQSAWSGELRLQNARSRTGWIARIRQWARRTAAANPTSRVRSRG